MVRATKLCFPPRMAPLRALACVGVLARPPCQAGSLHACPCGGVPEPVRDVVRRQSAADAASHGRHLSHGGPLRGVRQLGWLLVARGAEPARAESASEVRGAESKCWKLRGANVGCSLGVHTMETKTTKHKNKEKASLPILLFITSHVHRNSTPDVRRRGYGWRIVQFVSGKMESRRQIRKSRFTCLYTHLTLPTIYSV